jgi:hypothetical protein
MSKVKKYCSVLNFVKHNDSELYDLIQDLCLGRLFMIRKGSNGLTFLHPDDSLKKKLLKSAISSNDDEVSDVVKKIKSLILPEFYKDLSSFKGAAGVESVDGSKVKLDNGAVITVAKSFDNRSDRESINVFHISGEFPPEIKQAAKTGGADLTQHRRTLFDSVLKSTCSRNCEPAMELLVGLHKWAVEQKDGLADVIASQCSYDALASLAIILQPAKTTGDLYISDDKLTSFVNSNVLFKNPMFKSAVDVFGVEPDVSDYYSKLVEQKSSYGFVDSAIANLSEEVSKRDIVSHLKKFYDSVSASNIPVGRKVSPKQLYSESELRVMSAIYQENDACYNELRMLFLNKCNLNTPYVCDNQDQITGSNAAFYFSTVYLIARSDALLYLPGVASDGESLSNIVNEDTVISINNTFKNLRAEKRAASQEKIKAMRAAFSA